jgi:hypothetical protein
MIRGIPELETERMWLRPRHTAPWSCKQVGADNDLGTVKRVEVPLSNLLVEGPGFQQYRGQEDLQIQVFEMKQ